MKKENAPLTVAEMNAHSSRGTKVSAQAAMKTPFAKAKKPKKGGHSPRRMPTKRRELNP